MEMIWTRQLCKTFHDKKRGEVEAVLPTDLRVGRGEVFGLLGPNGAGKTTFLRMLATVLSPTSGTACIDGRDLLEQAEEVKQIIGFLSGNTQLYGRLTPRELLVYFGELYEMHRDAIEARSEELFSLLEMRGFVDKRIDKLSTGQTQKTSIARCILHDPPLFIMDEPTLGLDVLTSRAILEFIRGAASAGKTVVLSTHYMQDAELLCDRIGLLHHGRILDIDTLEGYRRKCQKQHLAEIFLDYVDSEGGGGLELE